MEFKTTDEFYINIERPVKFSFHLEQSWNGIISLIGDSDEMMEPETLVEIQSNGDVIFFNDAWDELGLKRS